MYKNLIFRDDRPELTGGHLHTMMGEVLLHVLWHRIK